MTLTQDQERWASKGRQHVKKSDLRATLIKQEGRCALSGVKMIFKVEEGTPISGGSGCHPLYPAVDHVDPGNSDGEHQIVCYALNDLKGHLPIECFAALQNTDAWKALMHRWREQAAKDSMDRDAFMRLLRPNAKPKNR